MKLSDVDKVIIFGIGSISLIGTLFNLGILLYAMYISAGLFLLYLLNIWRTKVYRYKEFDGYKYIVSKTSFYSWRVFIYKQYQDSLLLLAYTDSNTYHAPTKFEIQDFIDSNRADLTKNYNKVACKAQCNYCVNQDQYNKDLCTIRTDGPDKYPCSDFCTKLVK